MMKTRVNGTVRPEMDAGLRRGVAAAAVLLLVCVLAVGAVSAADTVAVSNFTELQNSITNAPSDRMIIVTVTNNISITSQLPSIGNGKNITLTTNNADHRIYRGNSFGGNLFTVDFGGSLTITGDSGTNLTLDGMKQSPSDSLVKVTGGTFTLADGGILTNNTASYHGGGVYVNSGKFEMSGGTISDNTANNGHGGGVYVNSGKFEMSGGTISNNTANNGYDGGGVYVNSGTFTMSDDAVISGNTADDGGGVYVSDTFEMSGNAVISGNTAGKGGGVYMLRGTFELFSGTISGNTADDGGGVYVSSGTFTMSGDAVISGNTADDGGGVYVTGKFEMSGNAVISDNTANNGHGGGVYMLRGKFELSGSGSTDSVYLGSGKSITVTEELAGTDKQVTGIELADLDDGTEVVTFESTVSDQEDYVPYFTLSSSVGQNVLTYNAQSTSLVLTSAWKVTFDTTGGTPGTYDVLVAKDTPVTEPAAPTMTGHTFTGWYNESSCVNPWDFNTPVTGDITLYAGWKKDEPEPGPGPDPDPTPVPPSGGSSSDGNMENAFRVLFNDGATTLTVQTDLSYGDKLTKPEDPVKDGYTFAGWYKDSACTQPWDFETGIPGDMTLYAKWTAAGSSGETEATQLR